MTDTDSDNDRTEAPVSNEQLYASMQKLAVLHYGLISFVMLSAGYASISTQTTTGTALGGALIVGAAYCMLEMMARNERGYATTLYEVIPGKSVDETSEELEDRLTNATVADGGDER